MSRKRNSKPKRRRRKTPTTPTVAIPPTAAMHVLGACINLLSTLGRLLMWLRPH